MTTLELILIPGGMTGESQGRRLPLHCTIDCMDTRPIKSNVLVRRTHKCLKALLVSQGCYAGPVQAMPEGKRERLTLAIQPAWLWSNQVKEGRKMYKLLGAINAYWFKKLQPGQIDTRMCLPSNISWQAQQHISTWPALICPIDCVTDTQNLTITMSWFTSIDS